MTTPTDLANYIKDVWAPEAVNTTVESAILVNELEMGGFEKVGRTLQVSLRTKNEQGISYGLSSIRSALSMSVSPAAVTPPVLSIQSLIRLDALTQTAAGDKVSYGSAFDLVLDSARESLMNREELEFIYGGLPWATVNGAPVVTSTTNVAVVLAGGADAFLNGLLGAEVDFYAANGTTRRTNNGPAVVSGYNMATRTLNVVAANGTDASAILTTDTIYGYGSGGSAGTNNIFGLLSQITYRSTNFFGIDNTALPTLQGQDYNVGGAYSRTVASKAVSKTMAFLPKSKVSQFVSANQFGSLVAEVAGQIHWPSGGKEADVAFPAIDLNIGYVKAEVRAHPFVADQDGFTGPLDEVLVAGTNKEPWTSTDAGEMVVWVPSSAGYAITSAVQAQPIITKPNMFVRMRLMTVA